MTDQGLAAAVAKMRAQDCSQAEIDGFIYSYRLLESGASGLVPEAEIDPLVSPPRLSDYGTSLNEKGSGQPDNALGKTALLKLNGGLGTSMGLEKAKTLLPVREGLTFIDILVEQVLAARAAHGVRLPLLFMNSFRTRSDTVSNLERRPELPVEGIPLDFLQSQYPKIREDTLGPVEWPSDPSKEWCPPGHGEVFARLESSGVLAALLQRGFRYLSIANGDNLGAAPDARLASWFASSGAPFAVEVCQRTGNDRKGGHLAIRRSDGHMILRELAQTPQDDVDAFMDSRRHQFFNTNNLWVDIVALKELMEVRGTHLGLPLIRNRKTVDPADPNSPSVIQLETAMGAAIEVFDGATAIEVDRSRFLPVKTTNELLLVRSDLFELTPDRRLLATRTSLPRIDLDARYYQVLSAFEQRIPSVPSLTDAVSLNVQGDWTFGEGVIVRGPVSLRSEEPATVSAGSILTGDVDGAASVRPQ